MPLESDVAYLHISNGIRQSETLPHFAVKPAPKSVRGVVTANC